MKKRPLIGRRWGSLDGGPVRLGGRHFRLVVYPPGTDDRERRLLHALRWWPGGGPFVALVAMAVLGEPIGLQTASALAFGLFLGPWLWLRHAVRRRRRDLCVVHAEYLYGPSAPADLARCQRLVSLGTTLTEAERAFDRGELEPVEFQRIWGAVHAEARVLEVAGRGSDSSRPAARGDAA